MRCPFCHNLDNRVIDSRSIDESAVIRRRRECSRCSKRFTTYERVESMPLMVVKSDSRREIFDRKKLHEGIVRACLKRPISIDLIEKVTSDIEHELEDFIMEVPSRVIGEMVLKKLREMDEVAYVRFASIYRKFEGVDAFLKELKDLRRIRKIRTREPLVLTKP